MQPLRPYQEAGLELLRESFRSSHQSVCFTLPTGGGKCHTGDVNVLMYNGSIKNVKDVIVGDLLMGPDSLPRVVLSLARGREMCYDVVPVKGDSWGCNSSHILSLVHTEDARIVNISIEDYLPQTKNFKHLHKQYRTGVEFKEQPTNLDPYFLGVWLGDGDSTGQTITTPDPEIIGYLREYASVFNYHVSEYEQVDNKSNRFRITHGIPKLRNTVLDRIRGYNLESNKHIPHEFKVNSRENRLELLAGLIDTDGYLHHSGYEIITKFDTLRDDILFLARSLGFAAYSFVKVVKCMYDVRGYHRIFISGDVNQIPVRIARKKAEPRQQIKNALRTGFSLKARGIEDYYGFELDGDHLYLLADFTVTHNTQTFAAICRNVYNNGGTPMVLVHRKELMDQAKEKLNAYGIYPSLVKAGKEVKVGTSYVASVQTLKKRELPKITMLIVDECHLADFRPIVRQYKEMGVNIIGFTATPVSSKKHDLSELYSDLVVGADVPTLIGEGYLMPAKFYGAKEDLSDLVTDSSGEFSDKSQMAHFGKSKLYEGVIDNYQKLTPGTLAVVFNVNVEHSMQMTEAFNKAGIPSEHIDGTAHAAERARILARLESGQIKVLNSVAILTTGWDFPALQTVIINRATKSLALFLQMLGRGSRPSTGKEHFNVIDMGSNCFRLGFYDDLRSWDLEPRKGKKLEAAPMKECANCRALIYSMQMVCKHCGYEYPVESKPLLVSEGFTLIEKPKIVPDHLKGKSWGSMNIPELMELQESMNYKQGWIIRQLQARGLPALKEYARIKGYNPNWAFRYM